MKDRLALLSNIIEFIETNLQNPIGIPEVCEQSSYSAWEFQRIFRAHVGDSIGGYIRGRRLTNAAEDLINHPDKRILDVAIESQFNSQEAFARAFKTNFGITPSEIKSNIAQFRLRKKNRIGLDNLLHLKAGITREPQIVEEQLRHFIGFETKMHSHLDEDKDYLQLAPQMWMAFDQRRKEISNRVKGKSFGFAISEEGNMLEDTLTYFASVEVSCLDQIPAGMKALTLKPRLYAMFENVGHPHKSHLTIDYIYGVWLPNSDFVRDEGHDYEVFGQDYVLSNPESASTYCLPIKSK